VTRHLDRRTSMRLGPVLIALVILLAFVAGRLLTTDDTYGAELAHASGLRAGDEVRVAGIPVGTVESVRLAGTKAVATFTTERDVRITEDTRAAVKLSSLLGKRYLEVRPGDGGPLDGAIPLANTEPAYTLDQIFIDGQDELEDLDLDALGEAVDVLATDLARPSKQAGAALEGITSLSRLVASRDQQLGHLLGTTREVTDLVHDQQGELLSLVEDADLVMRMVYQRRAVIRQLLAGTRSLADEVSRLVERNQRHLRPLLLRMRTLLGVLEKSDAELEKTLELAGPVARYYANSSGDGPWVNVYAPYFLFPDNLVCPILTPEECR
jgi:phospholipid/cholesterol/gamma-HCH transport system substrate-binding protein